MARNHKRVASELIQTLMDNIEALRQEATSKGISGQSKKFINEKIGQLRQKLDLLFREIDPVRQPLAMFDPGNPDLVARFVALALVAQSKTPLAEVDEFYGSGVYAIYYRGSFEPYMPISGKEVPLYVGKAEPENPNARIPIEQGIKLSGRLKEHRKNIERAVTTLDVKDFECRYLVVQSGWEKAAESYLINFFEPIWNNETGICYGIGKHGDSAATRANRRSPWDTLHPGRLWAANTTLSDALTEVQIRNLVSTHLSKMREQQKLYENIEQVLDAFILGLRMQ